MNILLIGAHPDDCEILAGGAMCQWVKAGYKVTAVSATNGDAGHHELSGEALAKRRKEEHARAAKLGGYESRILDNHDGRLMPSMSLREQFVGIIRETRADVVLTHRSNDYHPDHRYTSIAVQDAAYMVMVPNFLPEVPRLEHNPVFFFMMDRFQRPVPFRPDIAVDVGGEMDAKYEMLDTMDSQFYEWLPWIEGIAGEVPADPEQRKTWLRMHWEPFFLQPAQFAQEALTRWYGPEGPSNVTYCELFEICEYGSQPSEEKLRAIFPSLPDRDKSKGRLT